jgi:hypothetical protein
LKFHSKRFLNFEVRSLLVRLFIPACLTIVSVNVFSQTGGRHTYEFLNVAPSARLAGLGGVNVSLADRDVSFFFANPALNGDTLIGHASVSYQFYVGDIGHAAIAYQPSFKKIGAVILGIQHMSYGAFRGYDQSGAELPEFHPQETALMAGKTHSVGAYTVGANLKAIFSNIAGYNSSALALDIGGVFKHPTQQLSFGLAIKNLGIILSDYSSSAKSSLPFDVQAGTTYKPEHMPIRFSVTAYNLTKHGLTYRNAVIEDQRTPVVQRIFTHFNFGGELLLHKNVNILLGYNYLNHRAQKLDVGGKGAGLSIGFAAFIKTVDFTFSRIGYVAGKGSYSFSVSTNVNKLLKRQKL